MNGKIYNAAIIGGGIIGTSAAMALQKEGNFSVIVLEAENTLAAHQTGNNSGVIHSGLYYKPGSLKAANCVTGREMMYRFCVENGIKHERCGKLVVAANKAEIPALDELQRRGTANGLTGIRRLAKEELREFEPHVAGIDGLFVPQTGIVDYKEVTEKYADKIKDRDGEIKTDSRLISVSQVDGNYVLATASGEIRTKILVNCAGLQSDRIARLCGIEPELQIVPFRGEYYNIKKEKEFLVKNLIYPVPDPRFPFLGVHFTRMINGGVEVGPNAVLAFKREGYSRKDFSLGDMSYLLTYRGFWKMAAKYYKMGAAEFYRSFSKKAFVSALQKLIPEITINDIHPGGAGVRAQALEPGGKLVDDFRIIETDKMVHVLNAPSPAATASLSIGQTIAKKIASKF